MKLLFDAGISCSARVSGVGCSSNGNSSPSLESDEGTSCGEGGEGVGEGDGRLVRRFLGAFGESTGGDGTGTGSDGAGTGSDGAGFDLV